MSQELFTTLVQGLCDMYKVDVEHVLAGGPVTMGGVDFCLLHEEGDSPFVILYCDFGKVPPELEAKAYKKLLEFNLTTYTGQGETFALSPEGHVFLANNYLLEFLNVEIFIKYLAMTGILAKSWREGYFLDENESSKKQSQQQTFLRKHLKKT
jgi:Tir chaperone protein (CesT) family